MNDVVQMTLRAGGVGVVYWEPAWVSSRCKTRWGTGSHWENATLFDFTKRNELTPAAGYLKKIRGLQP
jgi:arabinogalactan endo-1,4-beta-galactosidase